MGIKDLFGIACGKTKIDGEHDFLTCRGKNGRFTRNTSRKVAVRGKSRAKKAKAKKSSAKKSRAKKAKAKSSSGNYAQVMAKYGLTKSKKYNNRKEFLKDRRKMKARAVYYLKKGKPLKNEYVTISEQYFMSDKTLYAYMGEK